MSTEFNWNTVSTGWHVFMDGKAWCAVGPDFVDYPSSPAGCGDTPESAVQELREFCANTPRWQRLNIPPIEDFTVHDNIPLPVYRITAERNGASTLQKRTDAESAFACANEMLELNYQDVEVETPEGKLLFEDDLSELEREVTQH